jgi:N-acetylglutamate synthase-like GNAT family acetyltransferase
MIQLFENDLEEKDLENINKLLNQLNSNLRNVSWNRVAELMGKSYIFSARDLSRSENNSKGELIGMASLIPIVKLAAFFGNVEDVIVFEEYRGQGIGKELMKRIVEKGKELKMENLFLTSNKKREAARAIYKKFGFEEYDTTPFKLVFDKDDK